MMDNLVSQAQTKPKQKTRKEFARKKGKANKPHKHTLATRQGQIPNLSPPLWHRNTKKAKSAAMAPGDSKLRISNITSQRDRLHLRRWSETARRLNRSKGNAGESIPPLQ